MGAVAEIFKIAGFIGLQNADKVYKQLDAIDNAAKNLATRLGKMAKALDHAGLQLSRAFTVPLAAAGTAIGALALKTGDYADKILSMQEATGVSAETLQQFAHVAKTAGGSSDALFATITKLNGKLPAIADGTGKTAEAFARLVKHHKDTKEMTRQERIEQDAAKRQQAKEALEQIDAKRYDGPFKTAKRVGMAIDDKKGQITEWVAG
jgi:uncharacterized phage infection (PIP) family protein YhgE